MHKKKEHKGPLLFSITFLARIRIVNELKGLQKGCLSRKREIREKPFPPKINRFEMISKTTEETKEQKQFLSVCPLG